MTAVYNSTLGYDTLDIMVDIDDVVVPWFETVDAACRAKWGDHHEPCSVWSMWEHYGRRQDEWEDIVISAVQTGLYHTTEPIPGSVEGLNRLRWYGHRVHMVTARGFMSNGDNIRQWTPEYLENFGVGHDTLTFAKDKVAAQQTLGLEFDYAIDDGLHNFNNLREAGVNVYLQDAPHNRSIETPKRVWSLWEFANIVIRESVPIGSDKTAMPT